MCTKTIIRMIMGLASLTGMALADTTNIYGGFASMCDPETVKICSTQAELGAHQIFLCASCYDDNIKALDKDIASKLDLGFCLANIDGQLSWKNDGGFANAGCSSCKIDAKPGSAFEINLVCDCNAVSSGDVIPIYTALINLNEGIHVHNGRLVCYEYEGAQISASSAFTRRVAFPSTDNFDTNYPARNPGTKRNTYRRAKSPEIQDP
ncbi:hypothetical protein V8F20_010294 [Naviculisporaceae sp. PSN 640]